MKKILSFFTLFMFLFSCTQELEQVSPIEEIEEHGPELKAIYATIGSSVTRAATLNSDYIGRDVFTTQDKLTLTEFKRTEHSLDGFTYSDIEYQRNDAGAWLKQTQIPERLYWTDGNHAHTFKAFSTPQSWTDDRKTEFKNYKTGAFAYTEENGQKIVDFSRDDDELETIGTGESAYQIDKKGTKLKNEDLLINYNTNQYADEGGLTTTLHFKHALSSLRVIIDIQDFTPDIDYLDMQTTIWDLVLEDQPYKYNWNPNKTPNDSIDPGWGVTNNTPSGESVKIKTWQPRPAGEGVGQSKKFIFYSLIVPGDQDKLTMTFKVKYPDSRILGGWKEETYKAITKETGTGKIKFLPGHTTTLRISLNHDGEPIYIGAEYIDWEYVETPDRGELHKIDTFLDTDKRQDITIAGDSKATIDDATWLYYDPTQQGKLIDIYGNDGTPKKPFQIKTARQFLSFAYEVSEGKNGTGRNFEGQYINLESDINLQPTTSDKDKVKWPGIGNEEHPFNGTLDGGVRTIKFLNGKALFAYVGPKGHVCQLLLEDIYESTGNAFYVENNEGLICAAMTGTRKFNTSEPALTGNGAIVGAFCNTNSGVLLACHNTASFSVPSTATTIGGLVGSNSGIIVAGYASGAITGGAASPTINGVAGANTDGGKLEFCIYDKEKNPLPSISDDKDATGAFAYTTREMQSQGIVGTKGQSDTSGTTTLNGTLWSWTQNDTNWPDSPTGLNFKEGIFKGLKEDGMTDTAFKAAIKTQLGKRYYEYHITDYPWVW